MEWTQEEGVLFNVSISPPVPITFIGSTSVRLILSYNMEYNVTVEAITLCQNKAPIYVPLFYGEFRGQI